VLPFSAEVLFALHERYLAALWPAAWLATTLAVAAIAAVWRPFAGGDRAVAAALGVAWLVAGAAFHLSWFARLNFAAPVYAGLFLMEGALLLWLGVVHGRLAFRRQGLGGGAGLALAALALAGYPVADGLTRPEWGGLRLAGLAPGPTALLTLGLLLTAARPPLALMLIPALWCLLAGATGWILGLPADLALPPLAAAALGLALWRRKAASRPGTPSGAR
jgi:hypothetical protein